MVPAAGGTGTVAIAATRECTWTASAETAWLSVRSGQSGQGDGMVEFAAARNPDPASRRGALVVNGQRAEITQEAGTCDITLATSSASFTPDGGSGRVDVRASSSLCPWTATSSDSWIQIRSGADGRGSGGVMFDVAATTGPPRSGALTVAGQRFSVTQSEGCTFSIAPAAQNVSALGGNGTVTVTTTAGCPWTAASNVPWLSVSPSEGTGPGAVVVAAGAVTGPSREGTAVIAGQLFTVSQSDGCSFQVEPTTHSVGASGGTESVTVRSVAGCEWNASSDAPWMSVQTGSSGTGNGTVTFAVEASPGAARSGTLTVAGQKVTVQQSQGCTFSISPTQESVPSAGGGGRVTVTAPDGCAWTASSNAPWLTIASGASGSGAGAVQYTAAATTGPARSGTLTVAGQTFTVNQGQGCSFALAPVSATVANAGGQTSFDVQTTGGCAWTAAGQVPWITIASGASGTGNGTVQLTVAPNTGASRTGNVNVADKTFAVTQGSGCSFSLSTTNQTVPTSGGTGSVGVTAPGGCAWTASTNAPWLSISSGASGSGNGTVNFTAAPNTGPGRIGTLTIAGETFTVTQGTACTFTIAPEQQAISAAGGSTTVNVTAGNGCAWTAAPNVPWITVTSGASGTANGAVQLSIAANTGADRSGTATIAGRTFTVNQAASCTFTVNPETLTPAAAGGATGVDVTAAAGCAWTAATSTPWITISSGATGSGNGRVNFSIGANTGPPRTGSLLVAGRTVTVNQSSGCTFALSAPSVSIPQNGGSGSVNVIAGAGCTWTAVSQAPWIVVTAGASGSGNGTVQFTVQARMSGGPRSGTIAIAGQTFTVNQN
jgi:hypothetical protein